MNCNDLMLDKNLILIQIRYRHLIQYFEFNLMIL